MALGVLWGMMRDEMRQGKNNEQREAQSTKS